MRVPWETLDDKVTQRTYELALERVVELELAIELAAHALESSYGDLPKDRYPGPPTTIINNLRHVLAKSKAER